ncbi:hypothetical protein CEQ90_15535 [Lewinellaceae bacterium SD302]|nr:hypothetical protein CEQ90_15535 [Lewinellaceae bacterium SD302]
MRKPLLGLVGLLFSTLCFAQDATLFGTVMDGETGELLIGATIFEATTQRGTTTDLDGRYELSLPAGKYNVTLSYLGYESINQQLTLTAGQRRELDWTIGSAATILEVTTVTSGRYEKPLGEVTVSLEVLKPALLENSNQASLDGVLEKVPGVNITDGQPSIRGGAGYSYGAGSRVLLLIDDIPILQSDAGFPNWDDVPIENIEQIEVVKGAASALYGSSAMNGIVNVRTGFARAEPETSFSTFGKLYLTPGNEKSAWWQVDSTSATPYETGTSIRHARKMGKLDMVLSGYYYNQGSYERKNFDKYGRFTTSFRYRFSDRLSVQLNSNYNKGSNRGYFFWGGLDSLLYVGAPNTESIGRPIRYNLDPSVTYFAENGDRHRLLGRYYSVNNRNNANRSNSSDLFYGEYQYQKRLEDSGLVLTGGLVTQGTSVQAELYGDTTYTSRNYAGYLQVEKKFWDKLNVSFGARYEYNQLNSPEIVSGDTIPDGITRESKPVFRVGMNYRLAPYTFLRASWGQGYRYPTIAEKFIRTDFGGVLVSPNPQLESETGWTAELGIKQGFKVAGLSGFADFSIFQSRYQDMLEFSFLNLFVDGFQSLNVGDTEINGLEISIGGQGELFGGKTSLIGGYTYILPRFAQWDTTAIESGELGTQAQRNYALGTSEENILKYRNQHSTKLDIETQWGRFSLGLAGVYNSRIDNIDLVFQTFVVPGLADFRETETGNLVTNLRMAYRFSDVFKLSFLVDNALNEVYAPRPGILGAPRSVALRLDAKW